MMNKMNYMEVILLALFFGGIVGVPISNEDFSLRILHTNDMHARFEQTSALSTKCLEKAAKAGECYGGFARLATLIRQSRNSKLSTIFLNAGDTYQGTTWFTVHKWRIVAKFLNLLAPDAICLGNHEFDDGVTGLLPFLEAAKFPVVTANLNLTDEPELAKSNLKKSVVLNIDNKKIGVIGYLTPETKVIAQPGKVHFLDEVEAVKAEVQKLQSQDVNILIALGHSGFSVDKKIAAEVDGIDLVIGGHTNTFLYTGKEQPDLEAPEGFYPTQVIQKGGRKVYVVQAYAYTKYLGNLTVNFDENGEVKNIEGEPILVDNSIEQAQDILDELEMWRPAIDNLQHEIVGSSRVLLDGDTKNCRRGECNFGNMIADAMVDYNAREYGGSDGWTDTAISLHTSGSVRASIDREPDDTISMSDILAALPFNNGLGKINLMGKVLREVLEWSVYDLNRSDTSHLRGAFMHFSGLQVDYDLSKPNGAKVLSVYVRCAKCRIPDFELLNDNESYTILLPDFLSNGGDGYEMLKPLKFTPSGVTTDSVVADYIRRHSPVHPEVEWRINFVSDKNGKTYYNNESTNKNSTGGSGAYQPITLAILITISLSLIG